MPDVTVSRSGGRTVTIPIRIGGPDPTFLIKKDRIEATALRAIAPHHADLLDIVASVFSADGLVRRGGPARPRLGQDWRRRLHLDVAVSDPGFWTEPDRVEALKACVDFLTEDDWSFAFQPREGEPATAEFLDFGETGAGFAAEEIILFSGGLDSLAGAMEVLNGSDRKVVLVTHRSAQKAIRRQEGLGRKLSEDFPGRVRHLQVQATNIRTTTRESTQRSRSLLFATLGYVTARMFGASAISFYENGIVSQQLPFSPQIVGAMATRTTHPYSLHLIRHLFSTLGDEPVQIRNLYEWLTKTEVVQRLVAADGAGLLRRSVSCTSLREETVLHPHCGGCSQCLDRRFAVLAAGFADEDPADGYAQDVLLGAPGSDLKRTMSLDWTRHGWSLADLSADDFMARFAGEIERIARGFPELSATEVLKRSYALQRRHGQAVRDVMTRALEAQAGPVLHGTLSPDALLRRFVSDRAGELQTIDAVAPTECLRPEESLSADTESFTEDAPKVRFGVEGSSEWIDVIGLGGVRGAPAGVAHRLLPFYDEDLEHGDPAAHRFIRAGRLATSKDNTAQSVKRCRDDLAGYYEAIFGQPPPAPLLIQTHRPKGYRLDPSIEVVERPE